jgi:hypothetical protein
MSDDAALSPKLCEEVLADGSYRLQYINTTGTPQLVHLPDGFTEHDPSRELDPLLGQSGEEAPPDHGDSRQDLGHWSRERHLPVTVTGCARNASHQGERPWPRPGRDWHSVGSAP